MHSGGQAHELGGFVELCQSRLPGGTAGIVALLVQIVVDQKNLTGRLDLVIEDEGTLRLLSRLGPRGFELRNQLANDVFVNNCFHRHPAGLAAAQARGEREVHRGGVLAHGIARWSTSAALGLSSRASSRCSSVAYS